MTITLRIDKQTERRLEALGIRNQEAFAQGTLDEFISEMEEVRAASDRLSHPEGQVTQEELERELGLLLPSGSKRP